MIKNNYLGKDAIVILGGTSINFYLEKLRDINKKKFIIFVETKCISKKLYDNKIDPDYIICPFSVKLKDNYFQNFVYRSFMRKIDIKKFIKIDYHKEVDYLKFNFEKFYETWRPQKGLNKRLKYKKDIFLNNSPYENLHLFPKSKIIINQKDYFNNFSEFKFNNQIIKIDFKTNNKEFNIEDYYNVEFENGTLWLRDTNFLNSQAICHFPILQYLGFKKIYFLGMDMNFLGSYEFDFREIFISKYHLYLFLFTIRKTLNGNFRMNFPIYLRPKDEFENLSNIIPDQNNLFRVVNFNNYKSLPKINEIGITEFLECIK